MAKPKTKSRSRTSKPRKPVSESESLPIEGTARGRMRSDEQAAGNTAARLIDQRDPEDWREKTLARMRALILEADPGMIEERKWRKPSNAMAGIPVWSHNGIVCTGETYTKAVKLTFAR